MTYEFYFKNLTDQVSIKDFVKNELYNFKVLKKEDINLKISISKIKNKFSLDLKTDLNGKIIKIIKEDNDLHYLIINCLSTLEKQIIKCNQKNINMNINNKYMSKVDNFYDIYNEEQKKDTINIVHNENMLINDLNTKNNEKLKKITPEEACIQLELLGDKSYLFLNSLDNKFSIIKKHENGYELLTTNI